MQVLGLAHDHHGHVGVKRIRTIIALRFTCPNVSSDIEKYVKSCLACVESNKRGKVPANVRERPVLHVPFEEACIDIVGPLPKGKGGN